MFLAFVCIAVKKDILNITFEDFSREIVVGFLDEAQQEKSWSPSTRNHRLARIRSFFRYASSVEPILAIYSERLRNIPLQKDLNKSFVLEYMPKEAVATVLRQPNTTKKIGIRDQFFMVLMYDSAARNGEMLSLKYGDFDPLGKTVYLLGKGNKPRSVPISGDTVQHFRRYAKIYHPSNVSSVPLFYTVRKGERVTMSHDNVERFLKQYGESAQVECPEVHNVVHAHLLRRSRAMHLYQAGMPLEMLAQFLGHNDPLITLVYARADNEMKRMAIERIAAISGPTDFRTEQETWDGNEEMIKRLIGLS